MHAAYIKGVPLIELARQYNVKDGSLRAYAARNGWQKDAADARQALTRSVAHVVSEKGAKFAERISGVLEKHVTALEKLDPQGLDLEAWDTLTKVLERVNGVGRKNYEMDQQEGRLTVNMAVQASPIQSQTNLSSIIDVESTSVDSKQIEDKS